MVCLCIMQICGRYMLHPHNEEQRKEHSSECQARHDRLAALRHSQGVECCVCLERVLDKPSAAERKFGLLSCEHPFCLGCIRGWRSHHESGADTDTVRLLQHICLNVIFDTSQNCCLYHDLHASHDLMQDLFSGAAVPASAVLICHTNFKTKSASLS